MPEFAKLVKMRFTTQQVVSTIERHTLGLYIIHLMSGPLGNQLVLFFPSSSDVSLDFVSGNIRTRGKTKLTISVGI